MKCDHGYEFGKGCIECEKILDENKASEAARIAEINHNLKLSEAQGQIDAKIKSAMITPEFIDKRLDNFLTDDPRYPAEVHELQKAVVKLCHEFIDRFDIDRHDLVLLGANGTGKDHLAAAMGHELIAKGKTALVTHAEKIQRRIRDSYKNAKLTEQSIMDQLAAVDYLVINELGLRISDAQSVLLTEINNDRLENRKRTVWIGNLSLKQFHDLFGDRVYDRVVRKDKFNVFIFSSGQPNAWVSYRP